MSINLNSIHLPSFLTSTSDNSVGEIRNRIVRVFQSVNNGIHYNQLSLAATTALINLVCIKVVESIMRGFLPNTWHPEALEKTWRGQVTVLLVRITSAAAGLSAMNSLIKLEITSQYIAASIAATVVLQLLWQKVFVPEWNQYRKNLPAADDSAGNISEGERETSPRSKEKKQKAQGAAVSADSSYDTDSGFLESKLQTINLEDDRGRLGGFINDDGT